MLEHCKWTTFGGRTLEHGYTISLPCEPDGSGNDMLHGQKKSQTMEQNRSLHFTGWTFLLMTDPVFSNSTCTCIYRFSPLIQALLLTASIQFYLASVVKQVTVN